MSRITEKIKMLISKGKIDTAIEELQTLLKNKKSELFNQTVVLSAQYHKQMREASLSLPTDERVLNRIILSLTELCDEVNEKEELTSLDVNKASTKSNESKIRYSVRMKKRMMKDFINTKERNMRLNYPEIIIRSIDDTTYPNIIEIPNAKISPHFKVYSYDLCHDGIEIYLNVITGGQSIMDKDGFWEYLRDSYDKRQNDPKYRLIQTRVFGKILYLDIVDYELDGNEYEDMPIVYCKFIHEDMPYSEFIYRVDGHFKGHFFDLDKSKMTKF